MAIGRKKKSKKDEIKTRVSARIKKTKVKKQKAPKAELKTPKRFNTFAKNYQEAVARGKMDKSKALEKEMDTIKKYLNKDGTPNKRALRSEKARQEFREAVRNFNKSHKKWGKKHFEELGEKQALKKIKGSGTHAEREAQKAKGTGVDLTQLALSATEKYYKMVDLFALDSFEKLRQQLNIGSPVVERIASSGLTADQADAYFEDFLNSYNNLPQEAIDLAKQDDLMSAIEDLIQLAGKDNLKEVLEIYMFANKRERDDVVELAIYHAENGSDKSFSDFYDEVQNSVDPNNRKTWEELL